MGVVDGCNFVVVAVVAVVVVVVAVAVAVAAVVVVLVVVVAVQVASDGGVAAEAAGHEELWLRETASS